MFPSDQIRIREQAKLTYFPLGNRLKTNKKNQEIKQF